MAPPPFKTPPSPTGTWGQWCADRVARGLIGAALALPLRLRLRLVGGLVARGLAPLVGYQSRAMANLAYVWPHLSRAESRRIARAVAYQAGCTIIENYDMAGLKDRMASVPLTGDGVAALERARAEGTPVVLITGHYG
ncbi:MAG: lauroyl acyltransferase, partial [Paracoccaceae bacterium]